MGSCCSRNSQMFDIKKPYESGPQCFIKIPLDVNTNNSLTVECPYSHCNVLIWTKSPGEFSENFPTAYERKKIHANLEMSFNLISFHSYSKASPIVIDVLISFINALEDVEIAKKIASEYQDICIHIVVSEMNLNNLGKIILVHEKNEIFTQIYEQQLNLEKLLRKVFTDFSDNFNNSISFDELSDGLRRENPGISKEEVQQLMNQVDKNNDGFISFNEFSYWWKRGRQGKSSYLSWTKSWNERINFLLPKMNDFTERETIDRSISKKSIRVKIKELTNSKSSLSIKAGKSAKREEILQWVEEKMNLEICEMWIAITVTAKSDSVALQYLRVFEDLMYFLKHSFNSSTAQSNDNYEVANTRVQAIDNQIMLSFGMYLIDEQKSSIFSTLDRIQQLLKSPFDDYFYVTIKSDLNLCEMDAQNQKDLISSLGNGFLSIDSEHWAGFTKAINVSTEYEELLKNFLQMEGDQCLIDSLNLHLRPLTEYLKRMLSPITLLKSWVPMIDSVLQIVEEKFEQKLAMHMRYLNFGFEFKVESEDLVKFIKIIQ